MDRDSRVDISDLGGAGLARAGLAFPATCALAASPSSLPLRTPHLFFELGVRLGRRRQQPSQDRVALLRDGLVVVASLVAHAGERSTCWAYGLVFTACCLVSRRPMPRLTNR